MWNFTSFVLSLKAGDEGTEGDEDEDEGEEDVLVEDE